MTSNYSTISNPTLFAAAPPQVRRVVERGNARALLDGRLLHVAGDNAFDAAGFISHEASGMIVTGKYARSRIKRLHQAYPDLALLIEPYAVSHFRATAQFPFDIPHKDGGLFQPTLESVIDDMIAHGSDIALTPSGQIAKGDSAALKCALLQANALDRPDVVFLLNLAAGWLSDETLRKQVVAVIDRSRHPVAIAFIDQANPIGSAKRLRAFRRLIQECRTEVFAYRTDLAGFDARAYGAIGAAIGAYPSVRRVTPVGKGGAASDPTDYAPHMFLADLGRFARSKMMRNEWFVDRPGFTCNCAVCGGLPVDRLFHSGADRRVGHLHNVLELERLHSRTIGMTPGELQVWWHEYISGVLDTYPQLETYIGKPLKVPADVTVWHEN